MEKGYCLYYTLFFFAFTNAYLFYRVATLSFGSKKDCEEAFDSSKDVTVNGDKLAVEYSTN